MAITINGTGSISGLYAGGINIVTEDLANSAVTFPKLNSLEWGSSQASSGYQKLPSGLLIQWGSFSASSGGGTAVNFTIPFPNTLWAVVINATNQITAVQASSPTLTGFSGIVSSGTPNCYYIALGN